LIVIVIFTDGDYELKGKEDLEEISSEIKANEIILNIVIVGDINGVKSSKFKSQNFTIFDGMTKNLQGELM